MVVFRFFLEDQVFLLLVVWWCYWRRYWSNRQPGAFAGGIAGSVIGGVFDAVVKAALELGKALENPTKNLQALTNQLPIAGTATKGLIEQLNEAGLKLCCCISCFKYIK